MLRKSIRLSLIYLLEAVAALLALAIFGVGALLWRLSSGPVSLDFLREDAQIILAESFDGDFVALGLLEARFDPQTRSLFVEAQDVTVTDDEGVVLVRVPLIRAGLAVDSLLLGRIAPTSLDIEGGSLSVVRRADGAVGAGIGTVEQVAETARLPERGGDDATAIFELIRNPASPDGLLGRLRHVSITGAAVRISDEINGVLWLVDDAGIGLERNESRIEASVRGQLATPAGFVPLNFDAEVGAQLNSLLFSAEIEGLRPASIAPDTSLSAFSRLDAPVSIRAVLTAYRGTGIQAAGLDVVAGAGNVRIGDDRVPFEGAELQLSFDPAQNALRIIDAYAESDVFSMRFRGGLFDLTDYEGALPTQFRYELTADDGFADLGGVFPEPPRWNGLDIAGSLDLGERTAELDRFVLGLGPITTRLSGQGSLIEVEPGRWLPNIQISGPIEGDLAVEDVLRYWPIDLADGARRWVVGGIEGGRFHNARIDADIRAESLASGMLGNEELNLSFDAENARVRYISTMSPITNGVGQAVLRGNAFEVTLDSGRIGDIEILSGYVDIPRLNPKGAIARYGGRARARTADMLSLIDEEPLGFPTEYGIDPATVGGQGEASFEIRRAMLSDVDPDDIEFQIDGDFTDVSLPVSDTGISLTEGAVTLSANRAGLEADGTGVLLDTLVEVAWREDFQAEEGAPSTQLQLNADVGVRALDALNIPARRFLDGNMRISARSVSSGLDIEDVEFEADLTDAVLEALNGRWYKPAGIPGRIGFGLRRNDARNFVVDQLVASADGVDIRGVAEIAPSGRIVSAEIDRFYVEGIADVSARLSTPDDPDQPVAVRVSGQYFDASELMPRLLTPNETADETVSAEDPFPLSVTFDTRRLIAGESGELNDVSVIWRSGTEGLLALSVTGRSANGPFLIYFDSPEPGGERELRVEAQSLSFVAAAFGYGERISGGAISVIGEAPPVGETGPASARVEVSNLTLVQVPVLARLLAAGSFEGLGALLNGEGIRFNTVSGDLMFEDGLLTIGQSSATGPSLGVTAAGSLDFANQHVAIDGNLAPTYGVNSLPGYLPVIGDLLISRPGEGLIGITYSVEGPFDNTTVFANPLAVLAPGVLRRVFEGDASGRAERARAEIAAQEAGPLSSDLPSLVPETVLEALDEIEPERASQPEPETSQPQ